MRKPDDVQPDASPSDPHGISVWPTPHYSVLDVTEERFVSLWSRGIPLVVNGLLSRFHVEWSPQYFIERYGAQACIIVDCEGDTNRRITVGEFFGWFGHYEDRRECWKLKVSILYPLVDNVAPRIELICTVRTGHHRPIFKRHFQSSTRISVEQFQFQITLDEMEF